ncbi:MAG: glycosyltransferase, partial [Lentisphaeria bacterium]|nr:glycosyltransferase [Lentisphaeria bacterium]
MRILHIIPSMAGGGAEAQLVCLAGELVRKGLDTHVALLYERGDNLPALRDTGATIHVLEHFANAFDPRLFARIRHLLADVKPDLVQVWSTPIELYVSVLAPLQRVPWILGERNRGPWNPGSIGSPPIGQIANILRILCSYGAKQIVPNSQAAAERWHAVHFVGKKRVTRIANA